MMYVLFFFAKEKFLEYDQYSETANLKHGEFTQNSVGNSDF